MSASIKGLGERPLIMGILNITPDSFSDGGRYFDHHSALKHALHMVESGADIIDIGGESSRPGSEGVSVEEEIKRVLPVIKDLKKKSHIPISIDTTKFEVAEKAIDAGATIINDISGLQSDEKIAELAAKAKSYLILMHMRGKPNDMQNNVEYNDLIGEISRFFKTATEKAIGLGVSKDKIIIDPGIGFGKSVEGNYQLIKNLNRFFDLEFPIMVGVSRKSFIGKTLDLDVDQRLEGSLAAACYAILNGADIVRVHDVKETKRAVSIIEQIARAEMA